VSIYDPHDGDVTCSCDRIIKNAPSVFETLHFAFKLSQSSQIVLPS